MSPYLPAWAAYYAEGLPYADVYVGAHDPVGDHLDAVDRVRNAHGIEIIGLHHEFSYDREWLPRTVQCLQQLLLQSYSVVIFSAVDEILVPRQGWAEYLEGLDAGMVIRAAGYEVVHRRDQEPPLDLSQPWLLQRNWWYPAKRYSKPVISAGVPIYWRPGFAGADNVPDGQAADENLRLLHLHRIDFDICLARHREAVARRWVPGDRRDGPWRYALLEDVSMLEKWILADADDPSRYAALQMIPDDVKGAC